MFKMQALLFAFILAILANITRTSETGITSDLLLRSDMFSRKPDKGKEAAATGLTVARWSLDNQMNSLSYQNICAAYGILKIAGATGNTEMIGRIEETFRPYLLEGMDPNRNNAKDEKAHRWFGFIPLKLYLQTKNQKYLERGIELAEQQYQDADADGMPEYTSRWYVDDIYGATTMQSLAFACTGETKYLDRAIKQVLVYCKRLQNDDGMFYHGPESKFYWGRGIGWGAAAFAELLAVMPEKHPQRIKVMEAYYLLMKALLGFQGPEGMWYQLVDDHETWPETSCTGMFLFSMSEGVKNGWLPIKGFKAAVKKAWQALAGYVDGQGRLSEICIGTGRGSTREHYLSRPRQTGDPHGQAALLWAASSIISK